MIAKSHPYNPPSRRAQQQRCFDINNQHEETKIRSANEMTPAPASNQQQNSLYGLNFGPPPTETTTAAAAAAAAQTSAGNMHQRQSHMFDLANLQTNAYESNYAPDNVRTNNQHHRLSSQSDTINHNNGVTLNQQPQHQRTNNNSNSSATNTTATTIADMSLYSPSSSTSLLYHIYDQINVPNEHNNQQHHSALMSSNFSPNAAGNEATHQPSALAKKNNTTTILNPANLFGGTMQQQQQQQQHNQMQFHQHQLSQNQLMADNGANIHNNSANKTSNKLQQSLYSSDGHYQQHLQQQPYSNSTLHHHHHQPQHNSNYFTHGNSNHDAATALESRMMLDTILRQQHLHATSMRQSHRPLSSSGASSMSGQSMALTYGRQNRVPQSKQVGANLASVLQSASTLNHHLGLIGPNQSAGDQLNSTGACVLGQVATPGSLAMPKKFPSSINSSSSRKWKRIQQRARYLAYEYSTVLKCSLLLILLAFSLMSIIKFTFLNNNYNAAAAGGNYITNANSAFNQVSSAQIYNHLYKSTNGNNNNLITTANSATNMNNYQNQFMSSPPISSGAANPLAYPPLKPEVVDLQQQQQSFDALKSKLVIGEFVILSQNFTTSQAQRSLLAENIVKLMDQVFLSTDMRRVYSRMEVLNIRPNRPTGIAVDCNIILSESITNAAQQFGVELFDSLVRTGAKLANQANFIIDKNSIRFNTVPDKDLKSGLVPPGLISPSVARELINADAAPPAGAIAQPPLAPLEPQQPTADELDPSGPNSVVWSAWSQWSSCIDKNGSCDPQRHHSRLRKCLSQLTGEGVDSSQCKQRFSSQDRDFEVADCSASCSAPAAVTPLADLHIQSDEPSGPSISQLLGPQTAPSIMLAGGPGDSPIGPFGLLPAPAPPSARMPQSDALKASSRQQQQQQQQQQSATSSVQKPSESSAGDSYSSPPSISSTTTLLPSGGQQAQQQPQLQPQTQMSCSNCTSDEICLLLMEQKVPFCAKIKDRLDESGCGGWCKAQNQVCQPVGQNAFKCIHDSECLANEWRCHDSQCIPMSKRCDGHYNCYDNSDERDCPSA